MSTKPILVWDIETFSGYFLVAFKNVTTGNVRMFEQYDGHDLDTVTIHKILKQSTIVGFNTHNFDLPILSVALSGANCSLLKRASNAIIQNNLRSWQLEKQYNFKTITEVDSIDLIEVAPGMASLKIYGGRMHCQKMQDLPLDHDAVVDVGDHAVISKYCENDLALTELLYRKLLPQIQLREKMSAEYGIDLRSKSDAQIAEAVIKLEVSAIKESPVERPEIEPGTTFKYRAPPYVKFKGAELQEMLANLLAHQFVVENSGKVEFPEWMRKLKIRLGGGVYQMGIGGLHSTEKSAAHTATSDMLLIDRDVTAYYPSIVLTRGLAPRHMGAAFSHVYGGIVKRRVAAKRSGDKVTNESLKITINGTFGKLGSKWSVLYSPDLMIATTVTGQLALLMLIENLELAGISVVSANTDGIVMRCPTNRYATLEDVFFEWETATGFETEETRYSALYSRDVNNFLALKPDGTHKAKGVYAPGGLQKTPSNVICVEAVIAHLKDGADIEDTIRDCKDITKFITVRNVSGGALDQSGKYLGKAVRWYYANGVEGGLSYKTNGYAVARTEGARPLMDLPDALPDDIDYEWYIREAESILDDIGLSIV